MFNCFVEFVRCWRITAYTEITGTNKPNSGDAALNLSGNLGEAHDPIGHPWPELRHCPFTLLIQYPAIRTRRRRSA